MRKETQLQRKGNSMNLDIVKATVQSATKGANIILEWTRPCKTRKACEVVISKEVRMVGRVGINYDNQASVQGKRESGELPVEPKGLPWGEWAIYPYLIVHRGKYYVRLYNGTSATVKPSVQYKRNGLPVNLDEIKGDLLASELSEKKGDCFTCKVENMTTINWEPAPPKVERDSIKETVEEPETVTA